MRRPLRIRNRLFLITVLLIASSGGSFAACRDNVASLRGAFGTVDFTVEIADDPQERAQGLMHRTQMARSAGMLFIYDRPQPLSFWMRNTLIPLDMIFIDPEGRIARIHENAIPLDETPIDGGDGLIAVLEINGGLSGRLGIAPGDLLRHPGLPQTTSLWPCEGAG